MTLQHSVMNLKRLTTIILIDTISPPVLFLGAGGDVDYFSL